MITRLLILLLCSAIFSELALADANSDAFNEGKSFGATQNSTIKPAITPANGSTNVPGYSETSGESVLFNNGNGTLSPSAIVDVDNCNNTTSTSDPNSASHGHCESVRMLTTNPNKKAAIFPIDKASDPLIVQGHAIQSNPTTHTGSGFGGGTYSACVTKTTNTGAVYEDEYCTESLNVETAKCKRGFSADIGVKVQNDTFNVDQGSSVAVFTAKTFDLNFNVTGTPDSFILNWYRIDNYGQVWINGTKVYENVLPGYTDMRYGKVSRQCSQSFWGGTQCSYFYLDKSNKNLGRFYDDGCNFGCRGLNPNLDITQYIKEGNNKIELVCANEGNIGPCAIKIFGTSRKLVMLGSLIDNQCAAFEARAK